MTTLTEFLLARIAEDEADARGSENYAPAWRGDWAAGRVLAECEAKRRIVAEHPPLVSGSMCAQCRGAEIDEWDRASWPCPTLRAVTAVYSDHPDYCEEWKP